MRALLPLTVIGSYPLVLESPRYWDVQSAVCDGLRQSGCRPDNLAPEDGLTINALLDQLTVLSFSGQEKVQSVPSKEPPAFLDVGISVISGGQPSLAARRHMSDSLSDMITGFHGERLTFALQTISKFALSNWKLVAPRDDILVSQPVREAIICNAVLEWWHANGLSHNIYRFKLALVGPTTYFFSSIAGFPEDSTFEIGRASCRERV